jgi:PAS domain S-box-containing protein
MQTALPSDLSVTPVRPAVAADQSHLRLIMIVRLLASLTLAVAITVLIGWYLRASVLVRVYPTFAPMQINAALGFAFSALAILFATTRHRKLATTLALVSGALGAITVLEYVSGRNFGIDQLFFTSYIQNAAPNSGRMSPITGTALTSAAVATLLLTLFPQSRRLIAIGAACALMVGAFGLSALTINTAGLAAAYGWGPFTKIALGTAISLVFVSAALIAFAWLAERLRGEMTPRWLWPGVLIGGGVASAIIARALSVADTGHSELTRVFIPQFIFLCGLALSAMLARAVYLTQITRRQRDALEQQMQLREQVVLASARNSAIVTSSDDAIASTDRDGKVLTWNHGAELLYGYAAADIVGRHVSMLVPPERLREFTSIFEKLIDGQGIRQYETERTRKDGERIETSVTASPIRGADNTIVGMATVARDITQRRRHEREMEQALVDKEALLRELHHRVKNNLQVMASILGLQAYLIDDPKYRSKFDACRDRIRTMSTVHERIYRNESLATIDFAGLVRDLAGMTYRGYSGNPMSIDLKFDLEAVVLNADAAMPASLIVHELVANAFAHAFVGRKQGTIHVSLKRIPGNRIQLCVRDDGVGGVPSDSTSPTLGMKIVRDLVRQIDGELTVSNEGGAAIGVEFPDPQAGAE